MKTREKPRLESPADYVALAISTCGVGLIPFAPGTFGALVGLAVFYGLFTGFRAHPQLFQAAVIIVSLFVSAIGIWAGNRAEAIFREKDAQRIVVDEVAGQLITFSLIAPLMIAQLSSPVFVMIAGFVLFRAFDILKPYPIDRLQDLPAGLGVMFDDVVAGIYAAIVLSFLPLIAPQLLY